MATYLTAKLQGHQTGQVPTQREWKWPDCRAGSDRNGRWKLLRYPSRAEHRADWAPQPLPSYTPQRRNAAPAAHCVPRDGFASHIAQKLSFTVLTWTARSEFCHHTEGAKKFHFPCKALAHNNMTYKTTTMIPIKSDSKSMPINSRTLNRCYGLPTTTVCIFTFIINTSNTSWLNKNTKKIWSCFHI